MSCATGHDKVLQCKGGMIGETYNGGIKTGQMLIRAMLIGVAILTVGVNGRNISDMKITNVWWSVVIQQGKRMRVSTIAITMAAGSAC